MKGTLPPRAHALLVALALCLPAWGVAAQTAESDPLLTGERVGRLVRTADAAHASFDLTGALDLLQEALDAAPDDYDALWRATREAVNLGMLATPDDDAKAWYQIASGYARRAREANPDGPEGGEWLAIALGRLALHEGPRSRVRLAVEIRDVALETLALDSTNAGAHHVLGEWNAQIRRLSGIERWMAKKLLGGSVFDEANWEDAERHLELAIRYDPGGLIHYLDLAKVYQDVGREEEAFLLAAQVLARPSVGPVDSMTTEAAETIVRSRR
jgi:tetratricopeptide (TPR) repeat protein